MTNNVIHLSNRRTDFFLQSIIPSDDISWITEGIFRTNITTHSQVCNLPPFNINESIQAILQIESSHQDCSIEYIEPMDIDSFEEFHEATQFLAMLEADETFPPFEEPITEPESSH